jgi:hypothetical protein
MVAYTYAKYCQVQTWILKMLKKRKQAALLRWASICGASQQKPSFFSSNGAADNQAAL